MILERRDGWHELYNLCSWLDGLDTRQPHKCQGFNPRCRLLFVCLIFFLIQFSSAIYQFKERRVKKKVREQSGNIKRNEKERGWLEREKKNEERGCAACIIFTR